MRWVLVRLFRYVYLKILSFLLEIEIIVSTSIIFLIFFLKIFNQAITYLMLLNHLEDDPGPHLIVCPASVLENWERELKKWCPSFSVLQYHGAARTTHSKQLNSLAKSGLPPPFNVILVCYSLFERHRLVTHFFNNIQNPIMDWVYLCSYTSIHE